MIENYNKAPLSIRGNASELACWLVANKAHLEPLKDPQYADGLLVDTPDLDGAWYFPLDDAIEVINDRDRQRMQSVQPAIHVVGDPRESQKTITVSWFSDDGEHTSTQLSTRSIRFLAN